MQSRSNRDEDDQRFSKLQYNAARHTSKYRWALSVSLGIVLVIIGLCVVSWSSFGVGSGFHCGAVALASSCQPAANPTVVSSLTPTVPVKLVPTARPTFTPTPTPTLSGPPSQAPTATPILTLTGQEEVTNTIQHYKELIESGEQSSLYKAYNLLSPDVRDQEPFSDFVKNANYTLLKGCLIIGNVTVTQADDQTWDGSIPVTKVSCLDGTAITLYAWHFSVSLAYGPPEIISIGLYPVGTGY